MLFWKRIRTAKSGGSDIGRTYLKDGEATYAVYCYYHKRWELVSVADYGSKQNTATGLNTMCKEGVSSWTKQQRAYKKVRETALMQLAEGAIDKAEYEALMDQAEINRKAIEVRDDEHGFETAEETETAYEATKS
jgi:hypothetical protein